MKSKALWVFGGIVVLSAGIGVLVGEPRPVESASAAPSQPAPRPRMGDAIMNATSQCRGATEAMLVSLRAEEMTRRDIATTAQRINDLCAAIMSALSPYNFPT